MYRSLFRWPLVGLFLLGSLLVFGEGCGTSVMTCLTDEECGEGSFCNASAGSCQKECTSSADCPTDKTCFLRRGKCLGGETCANKPARSVCVNGHVHTIDGCDFVGDRQADCGLQGCLDGKCLQVPVGCGDGICDPTQEHCLNCPFDCACPSGELCDTTSSACLTSANCGDGTCDPNEKETCATCPIDCGCAAGQRCDRNQQICIDFPSCGNGSCEPNESEDCSNCPFDCACPLGQRCVNNTCAPTNPCGDGQCSAQQGENCDTCPKDCACPADHSCKAGVCKVDQTNPVRCGDQKCDKSESSASCCTDCGCPSGYKCENNACQPAQTARCGNGRCESSENAQNCCTDCGCPSGNFCNNNRCCSCIANEDRRCNGAQIQVCNADCTGWTTEQTCSSTQTCKKTASGSLACVNLCENDCTTEGQKRCNGGYAIQTCSRSSQGCLVWTTTLSCKTNEYCESGGTTCKTSACTNHSCPTLEAARCDVRTVQECQNDASGCRVWKTTNYCAPPQTCSDGKCIYDCGTSPCSLGAPYCSNNNVVQCETDTNGCRKLTTKQTCSGGKICKNPTTGVAYCECSHKCTTEGEKQCNTNMPQECRKNTSGCREWVNINYCAPPYTCSKGACIYGCNHTCELGPIYCSNNNVSQCEADTNGCRRVVTKQACVGGKVCKSPTTAVAYCECSHKCPTEGEKQCSTNQTQECRKNADGCREWVNGTYCTPPNTCSKGACVYNCTHACELGPVYCSNGNVVQCEADTNGCRRVVTKQTCSGGKVCKSPTTGVAYCECSHKCPTEGEKQCSTNQTQECRKNADGCREWVNGTYCTPPNTCSGGNCVYNCNHTCNAGPIQCSNNNVVQCEADANGCRRMVTKDTCGSRQTCKSPTTGVAYCECSHGCSSAGAKQCSTNQTQECQTDGDGCRYWANGTYCTPPNTCSGGNCVYNCNHTCNAGPVYCSSNNVVQCEADSNGCRRVVTKDTCGSRQTCKSPTTGVAYCECSHGCSSAGAKQCSTNQTQECKADGDGCRYWSNGAYCTPPYTCSGGNCVYSCNHTCSSVGAKQCNGNQTQECRTDGNGCRSWVNGTYCTPPYTCSGGNCIYNCSHQCSIGQKRCTSSTPAYIQGCRTNSNGCREWYNQTTCPPPPTLRQSRLHLLIDATVFSKKDVFAVFHATKPFV